MAICQHCRHEWEVRLKQAKPKRCPNCTSPAWDRALKRPGRPGRKHLKPDVAAAQATERLVEAASSAPHQALCTLDQAREILRRINA